jgi:hypothetical protein
MLALALLFLVVTRLPIAVDLSQGVAVTGREHRHLGRLRVAASALAGGLDLRIIARPRLLLRRAKRALRDESWLTPTPLVLKDFSRR